MMTLADLFEGLLPAGTAVDLMSLASVQLNDFVIDSRKVMRGDCFIALPGERVDGHEYVGHAIGRGAQVALVQQELLRDDLPDVQWLDIRPAALAANPDSLAGIDTKPCVIHVENTLAALQRLAAFWRAKFPALRVVGITGSVGKTTTKELVAQVLGLRYRVLKTEGNLNNEIGVPLSLLRLTPEHEYAVVEMGMYARGEIALLAAMAQPWIGVITLIAPVHLERLGSIDNIVKAKSELVEALPPDGVAILNDDDERVRGMRAQSKARVLTYGLTPRADIWADELESFGLDGISFTVHQGDQVFPMRVPLLGRHSVHTALRAAAVGREVGMSWEEILEGFLVPAPQLRLAVVEGPLGSLVLDDTYNASLESTLAALNLLEEVNGGKHVAVLGDMLELGDAEMEAHREVGCRAGTVAQYVICIGERAKWIAEEAVACGAERDHVWHVADNAAALSVLRDLIHERSVILVKGSRGMKMDEIVAGLAEMAENLKED